MANRIIEDADLAQVLDVFAQRHSIGDFQYAIAPDATFVIDEDDSTLHSINTLDLLWFDLESRVAAQANIAIIDGAKMGGHISARFQRVLGLGEVFDRVKNAVVPLPFVPRNGGAISTGAAREIRSRATSLLEARYSMITTLTDLNKQADAIGSHLIYWTPEMKS